MRIRESGYLLVSIMVADSESVEYMYKGIQRIGTNTIYIDQIDMGPHPQYLFRGELIHSP